MAVIEVVNAEELTEVVVANEEDRGLRDPPNRALDAISVASSEVVVLPPQRQEPVRAVQPLEPVLRRQDELPVLQLQNVIPANAANGRIPQIQVSVNGLNLQQLRRQLEGQDDALEQVSVILQCDLQRSLIEFVYCTHKRVGGVVGGIEGAFSEQDAKKTD